MKAFLAGIALFCFCAGTQAAELAGVSLANNVQMGESKLVLNGAGIRSKWFFDVYIAALYLPQKQTSAKAIIADNHEYRIALHMLRTVGSKKLFNAFKDAIEANHKTDELMSLDADIKQMAQIFEAVGEVNQDDVITLDYVPDVGTNISVNGTNRGTIKGVMFNQALLKIWLGDEPAQDDLKKEMLGG